MSQLHIFSARESDGLEGRIKEIFLEATGNLSWLAPGETVLLKPALNSRDPYPATTHPLALKAVAEVLRDRGARVIAADQSGLEHVFHAPEGVIKGSSEECYDKSDMARAGVEFIALERRGWKEGFYKFQSPEASSWPDGFYLSNIVKEADHIISLPRLSTHAMAGVTLGFKNFVGLLREDSRSEFHADGPFYQEFKTMAAAGNLPVDYVRRGKFFEKMTEISLALREKLRLTLIVGTKAQLTFGPDKNIYGFKAYATQPDPGLIFASDNQAAIEAAAIAFLSVLYEKVPLQRKFLQGILFKLNPRIKRLGSFSPWKHPFVRRALELGLGDRDSEIRWDAVPPELRKRMEEILKFSD